MTSRPVRRALSALLPAAALLLAGCSSGGGAVHVAAPTPGGSAAARCGALVAALPKTLMGQSARSVAPAPGSTAAWGDPAVTLRCGVNAPGALDPASSEYDPKLDNHDAQDVNGVCWLTGTAKGGGYVFTTIVQQTYVEVTVPGSYAGQQSPLGGLASAVLRTDPADPARAQFNCI
ncbi:DUF3515 domain-containing protein [Streptacidiphilus carbonis]|uniref:DUF3515 domain-containing protein n=1 Tax=Streptacidiphilus carbonis TaxID=105422 RepID=UPI0006935F89|nr:DUF3515 domain-containing protein [Streptacidiphilus carbonis]